MIQISDLGKSINSGVRFLLEKQLPWGEFCTYGSKQKNMENGLYIRSIFVTTFVLHTLQYIDQIEGVKNVKLKSIDFLLNNLEEPGVCRFYGKNSTISPDLDDSCCALAALLENKVKIDLSLCDYFLQYRDVNGKGFFTWMGMSPTGENDIDCVVNANIVFFYGLAGKDLYGHGVLTYLMEQARCIGDSIKAKWYDSPRAFTYSFSRALADGDIKSLRDSKIGLIKYLTHSQLEDGSWGNELETSLALVSFLNLGYEGFEVVKGIRYILENQNTEDGSWNRAPFFIGPLGWYGSEELTTAICLEALCKFQSCEPFKQKRLNTLMGRAILC